MQERSLRVLEFNKIRAQLAEFAATEAGRARCEALRPMDDPKQIEKAQAETEEAVVLLSFAGVQPVSPFDDCTAQIGRAKVGSTLSPKELLNVATLMRASRYTKQTLLANEEKAAQAPLVCGLASLLCPTRALEEEIGAAIVSEEELADNASPKLASIRRKIRSANERIREKLNTYIHSPSFSKYLQDPIITVRSGRYVLPVKAENRQNVPGLIHDQSGSGATLFIEPMAVVEINNSLREMAAEEREEIERILAQLSAGVSAHAEALLENQRLLAELDFIFAKGALSRAMFACQPKLNQEGRILIKRGRHPLIDREQVVPLDLWIGQDFTSLVITGPNTGGKTVTLKTIGLLTLMAECGLHIPADDGSAVNVYEQVFADIGDEQSIEQSLSTFSSHTKNIVEILKVCDKDSLVLFDELCAGTDPAEGAALAISIIEFCRKCGAGVAATTHYAELKLYAMRTSGVMNASCEFNVETLQPTYRLLIGVPGKSNAFAISKRLGIDEAILEQARSLVSQNDVNFEDVLTQLDQQRQEMEKAKEEAERLRRETEKQKEKSDEYYAQIKQEKEKAAQQARKEAQYIIDDARRAADAVYEELKQLRKQAKNGAFVPGSNEKQAQLRRSLNEAESRMQPQREEKQRPEPTRAIRVGDTVELLKLGTKASVLAINKDGSYQLRAGIMQITAKPEEVYLLENETQNAAKKVIAGKVRELKAAAQPELDIRGMAVDEALPVLDNFLDAAYMGNLPNARIIHGKGTGVLRAAVQEELRRCKYVKSFRLGVYGEGESGVTIVEFK